jgi:hypothetical protein
MTLRYCSRCAGEVEDAGGFCLLGHRLSLEPLIPPLAQMRGEVARALGAPRVEVLGADGVPKAADPYRMAAERARIEISGTPGTERQASASREADPQRSPTVWEVLQEAISDPPEDPMAAFSPPSRMDWGPQERTKFLTSLRLSLRPEAQTRPRRPEAPGYTGPAYAPEVPR